MSASDGPRSPRLTLADPKGKLILKYYQCCGTWCSPGETGWVVSIEREGQEPVVKTIEVEEVLEDLNTLVPDEEVRGGMILVLRWGTEEMIEALENGEVAASRRDGEPTAQERLVELRGEVAGLTVLNSREP